MTTAPTTPASTPSPTRRRTPLVALGGAAATAALGLALATAPASAHVTVTPTDTAAGAYAVLAFSVGHGCDGSPTTRLRIQVPEGVNAVTPTRSELYDVSKQTEQLDPPATDSHGNELTERVSEVVYTARTPLPDGFRDVVELSVQLPDAAGETLAFPVIQECQRGETGWTEVAAEGQDPHDLEAPAPTVTVTEAGEHGHDEEADPAAAEPGTGSDTGSDTESDTESAAADGGGSDGLAVAGLVAGVLGLLLGGAAFLRAGRTRG